MAAPALLTKTLDAAFGRQRKIRSADSVLLTFDDGPHPEVTPAVLDRLRKYGARALFFVVGSRISKAPHLLERILAEGHVIGNHSYEHRLEKDPRLISYLSDVRRCQRLLMNMTGVAPKHFRAPMGRQTAGALFGAAAVGLAAYFMVCGRRRLDAPQRRGGRGLRKATLRERPGRGYCAVARRQPVGHHGPGYPASAFDVAGFGAEQRC